MAPTNLSLARILLVEDDEVHRATIADILDDAGYLVDCVAHGQEALGQLRRGPSPRVILLDLSMPTMNGFDFRRRQLADPAWALIPVLVISALADAARAAPEFSAAVVMDKPFAINDLLSAVARLCS